MKKFKIFFALVILLTCNSVKAENKGPDFSLSSLSGNTVELSQYKGKVVYLDFWASWCVPCRKSFPWMNEMLEKYQKQGLEIIAINLDEKRKMVETFLKRYPAKFTIALDPEGKSAEDYQVRVMPTSYIIDKNGEIIDTHLGFRSKHKTKLEEKIKAAL